MGRILFIGLILFNPFIQGSIKSKPDAADGFFQIQLLFFINNELDFVGSVNDHLISLSIY